MTINYQYDDQLPISRSTTNITINYRDMVIEVEVS